MLLEYTEAVTARIIARKQEQHKEPCTCTLHELLEEAREDITECMRQLARDGKYRAAININKIPMLLPKK